MTPKFEAVKEHNGPWTVKTQIRKGGNWYTVVEAYAVPGVGNSEEIAQRIAKLLNDQEEGKQMAKKILRYIKRRKSVLITGKALSHKVNNNITEV